MKVDSKNPPLPKVADYISAQIGASKLKQKDIAEALGYSKPNIVTMFKQGLTKLPIVKVGPFAKAIGVDPIYLLRIVMADYMLETYQAVTQIFKQELLTENEQEIIAAIRLAGGDKNLKMRTDRSKEKLTEFAKSLS